LKVSLVKLQAVTGTRLQNMFPNFICTLTAMQFSD
jgi:hypothetical protein